MGLPIVDQVLGGLGGLFSGKAKADAAKDQTKLNNAFLTASDQGKKDIIAQLAGHGYDIYGPQTSTGTSSSSGGGSSNTRQRSHTSADTTRTTAGENIGAENALRARIEGRLANKAGVSQGEILNQIANINRNAQAANVAVANKVASRGLGGAAAGAAYTPGEIARTSSINDFLASVPQLARQRQAEDEGMASDFLNARAGQHQESDTNSVGNTSYSNFNNGSSSNTGGPDINTILGLTMPTGPQQSMKTGTSLLGSALSGAGGAGGGGGVGDFLGSLFKPKGLSMPTNLFSNQTGSY